MHYASGYGSEEAVKYLLDLGADPNGLASWAVRPAHEAVQQGRINILKILQQYGADLSLTTSVGGQPSSTPEWAYMWNDMTCLWDVIDLAPGAFTSDQYYNVLYQMKREKLKKSAEYQKLNSIYKQQKAKEKAHKVRSERLNPTPRKPIITAKNAKSTMNWILFLIGMMILVGIFGAGGEDVYDDMYDDSRTLRRR